MSVYLQLNNVTKAFGHDGFRAVDALSLQVNQGEVYGFLGANGAGKSTTIRMILNFIHPTSGTITVLNKDSQKQSVEIQSHVGYLAGDVALWPRVTGNDIFGYLANMQGGIDKHYLTELVSRFEAEPNKRVSELSKGNRQKIGIIQALMHQPDVLVLDEPTTGLDPLMQEVFYETIKEASKRGAAVFVSSHNLSEAERMCDRIGIIRHGKLVHEQNMKSGTRLGGTTIVVTYANTDATKALTKSNVLSIISVKGKTVTVQPKGSIEQALQAISKYPITRIETNETHLEDDFLEFYASNEKAAL
jgi:ABC-2 type transport system ATP-binding protein